jgi:ABC-2 type transport system permease protein
LARALLIAGLITGLGIVLVHIAPRDWVLYLCVIAMVSIWFSALGLIFGLLADKFDHIAILTTFVIMPLTFVGGVFTSATMLPPALRNFELFNPIFYTIDAFRRSYTGESYLPIVFSLGMIALLSAIALGIVLRMTAIGYKLRT